mmetsp:Transcript_45800/g.108785  ORF Transcript_45800/g.108785 Transcript_45800/m.108785 type:complete len:183 (+) Transcript_45800:31-579(+)
MGPEGPSATNQSVLKAPPHLLAGLVQETEGVGLAREGEEKDAVFVFDAHLGTLRLRKGSALSMASSKSSMKRRIGEQVARSTWWMWWMGRHGPHGGGMGGLGMGSQGREGPWGGEMGGTGGLMGPVGGEGLGAPGMGAPGMPPPGMGPVGVARSLGKTSALSKACSMPVMMRRIGDEATGST